jgi:hypothetical protein
MDELPNSVRPFFVAAGWYPGRRVEVPLVIPAGHVAARILSQFGGLKVGQCGRGQECATSDIAFEHIWSEEPEISVWSELLDSALFSIGEYQHRHGRLYVDGVGRLYSLSLIHDAFAFEGSTFGEAMERLLLGRRSRPMLLPGQDSVTLYGEVFTADHPSIYRYR